MNIKEIGETAANLEAMAMTAATTYYDNAVRFGVSRYPRNGFKKSRNWSRFMQIARMCMLNDVPVDKFVNAAFLHVMERHPVVTASDICGYNPKSILNEGSSASSTTGASSPQDMWNLLSCKLLDMVFAIDGIKDKIELLDNTMYGFPAWFRVFSPGHPVQKIIVHWGDLAFEEISEDPKLEEYLKNKRPHTFKLLKSVMEKI